MTFTAGETTQTISVATLDDTVPEAEEGFTVVLSWTLGDDTGEGTIIDDDQPLELAIDDAPGGRRGHGGVRGATERGERLGGDGGLRDGGRDGEGGFGLHGGLGQADLHGGRNNPTISVGPRLEARKASRWS